MGKCLLKCPALKWEQVTKGFMVSRTLYSGTNSLNIHCNAHYERDKLQARQVTGHTPTPEPLYIGIVLSVVLSL